MQEHTAFTLIDEALRTRLYALSVERPTAVQEQVIPKILAGQSIIFQSETGTGKTFAYLLPLLTRLIAEDAAHTEQEHSVRILIAAPTFELASQIKQMVAAVSEYKTALFIGGAPIKRQIEALKEKPRIAVGTPARLIELIRLKKLKVQNVMAAVFDEADRLIKKELKTEAETLKSLLPKDAQLIACSATADSKTQRFFFPAETLILPAENVLTRSIEHWALHAESRDKIDTLRRFLLAAQPAKALVFTSRADQAENIAEKLSYKKIECAALHAKADSRLRKTNIDRFKSGKCALLVTSDLAARGLDIADITHIIQMDVPPDADFFIHRAGRTARAGKSGVNVVIGDAYELRRYAALEKQLGLTVYPKILSHGKLSAPDAPAPLISQKNDHIYRRK